MKRVVVTGLGALTPIGNSVRAYDEALKAGKSGAATITKFDPTLFKTQFACEVKDFDPTSIMDRREARRMDLFSIYALAVAREAMEDAGIDLAQVDLDRAGVIWGSGIGGLKSLEEEIVANADETKPPRYNPFMIPKMISDIAPGHISMKYGFRGINYGTISACASASHALINSFDAIRLGKADVIISGGSEASVTRVGIGGFSSMKALSSRNDDPASASRPFDVDRDGFVLGEGGGALILEELEHAKKRGAKIYGEIIGGGMTADAHHITAPHPEGLGAMNVMKRALEDARIDRGEVDYINVHGTSTPLGDIAELKAIKAVFGDMAYDLNISSTKSMTGHLLGASGAVEAIASLLAINESFIPPTINHHTADPDIDPKLNLTLNTLQEREVNTVLCNTFGFGGHNTCIVLKKF